MRRALALALLLTATAAAEPIAPAEVPAGPSPSDPPATSTPPPPGSGSAASPRVPESVPARPIVAVFPVHVATGVAPTMAALVAEQLQKTAERVGYGAADPAVARDAAARARAAGALRPEQAAGLVRAAGARVGLFASVRAESGRYQVSLQVVRADGAAASSAEAAGVSRDLWTDLDRALAGCLPPPAALERPVAARPAARGEASEPPEVEEPMPPGRFRIAGGTAAAFGVYNGEFRNHLLGLRVDRRFSDQAALGLGLYYANLKGKEGRAHNVLPFVQFEYRIDLGAGYAVPLRYASGYLPNNGPVVHGAAGLAVPLAEDVELGLELLAPTVWIVQERAVLSLDVAVELGVSL